MPRKRSSDQRPRDRRPSGGLLENPEFSMQNLTNHGQDNFLTATAATTAAEAPSGLQDNPLPVVPNWEEEAQAYGNFQQSWQPAPAGYTPATHYGEPAPQVQATPYNHPAQYAEYTSFGQLTQDPPISFGQPTQYNVPYNAPYNAPSNAPSAYLHAQLVPLYDPPPYNTPTPYNMATSHAQPDPNLQATANLQLTPSGQPNPYIQQEGANSHGHEHGQVEHDPSQDASANRQRRRRRARAARAATRGATRGARGSRAAGGARGAGAASGASGARDVIPCPHCDKTFEHKTSQVRHAKSAHNNNPNRSVCRICGKTFGRNDTMIRHLRDKHDGALP
ncbi:hypothetical protein BC567DRAFT_235329 [Phyllosticta citribraziliensis]